ncbi:50S ribosomal protein L14e [Acidianus manzaensis]|uniref:Large ribosomal subunit protein eL14 n=1 Tax=Acidianus manzaensis TaxID=282676 RepID=A0A1W6K037_9CREN|nr:50S ribosomal protein L14e [Acidianus manzaensis]ARM75830.1 50S ribosomal protein L14e [Acidianus manzaensis]
MPAIEIGRICVKTRGKDAGKKCVIADILDDNFVLITGPKKISGIKRKRANILHLEPTDKKIDIQKGASDDDIEKKIQEANLTEFMKEKLKIKIPVI